MPSPPIPAILLQGHSIRQPGPADAANCSIGLMDHTLCAALYQK